jgi:Fe-S-cluster containining protein
MGLESPNPVGRNRKEGNSLRVKMVERKLGLSDFLSGLEELFEIYRQLDLQIEAFKKSTGLECLPACGRCCEVSFRQIEASVFEMLPLAIHLWETGRAEQILKRLEGPKHIDRCVLFDPQDLPSRKGHCSAYPYRGLLCRLFGFSAVEDKYGRIQVSLCAVLKNQRPGLAEGIQRMVDEGLNPPLYRKYADRIILAPSPHVLPLLPINEAIRKALILVGYRREILSSTFETCLSGEPVDSGPYRSSGAGDASLRPAEDPGSQA